MKYLLDTHILLWIAYEEQKISKKVKGILASNENQIFISSVSLWEISLKYNSGKLDLKHYTPETLMEGFMLFFDYEPLDLKISDTLSFYQLNAVHHKDPFDRMLIWQALRYNLCLITDDEQIQKYKDVGLQVFW